MAAVPQAAVGRQLESRGKPAASLYAVISTNNFKNGSHIEVDGQVFRIIEFQHVKPGKGPAFVRSKLRNVGTGAVIDKTFRAGEKLRSIHTEARKMQYLYESGDEIVLMDTSDYEQISLPKSTAGDSLDWMLPNDEVEVLFVDGRPDGRAGAERGRADREADRSRRAGRHRLGRGQQARDARVRRRRSRCRSS